MNNIQIAIGYSNVLPGFYENIWMPYKKNIHSIFFSAPKDFGVNNARGVYTTRDALQEINKMRSEKTELDLNLLLNCACTGNRLTQEDEFRVKCLLNRLYDMECFTSVTVSNAWYLRQVLKWKWERGADVDLHGSVIWDIKSIDEVENIFWRYGKNCLHCINISRKRVHDLEFLEKFKNHFPDIKVKLITNEWCMHNCPEQTAHANYLSHWAEYNRLEKNYIGERLVTDGVQFCVYDIDNFWRFLCGKGVPPDCLHNYDGLVDIWKIGSRSKDPVIMAELVDAYIYGKQKDLYFLFRTSHGGISLARTEDAENAAKFEKIYLPAEWFKRRLKCGDNCYECKYCKHVFNDLLKNIRGG